MSGTPSSNNHVYAMNFAKFNKFMSWDLLGIYQAFSAVKPIIASECTAGNGNTQYLLIGACNCELIILNPLASRCCT